MNSRFIGGILLIVGTSIGAGMLALPVANAATGFWQSSLFLLGCWALMTVGALFILEVNLYLPPGKHMVSMAEATLGSWGLLVAWLSYLFLLYTLLSAYISGGSDVFGSLFASVGIHTTAWQSSSLFTLLFGCIVYSGIRQVDWLNRGLMFGKLFIYFALVGLIAPHVNTTHFLQGQTKAMQATILILITSFGFAIIVPNLRDYFNDDIKQLRRVVLFGYLITLLFYLAGGLGSNCSFYPQTPAQIIQNEQATSALARLIATTIDNRFINSFFNAFTSICMLTAFLGVSLCLISFLADGFKLQQRGKEGLALFLLTFAPPLFVVLVFPGAYIAALNYAGLFCVILLLLLPALMVLSGRKKFQARYRVPGGNTPIWIVIGFSILLIGNAIYCQLR